jgi:tripartite-type tricarboxylate transporter receptor subunit TctC
MTRTPVFGRRRGLAAAFAVAAIAFAGPAFAQQPLAGKTVRLLVGFPPGGGTDAIARILAEGLKDELGTTVIVENKPGAGGQLAAQALKAAAPDGATLFLSHDHSISILPQVVKQPGFDPAVDFVPVAGFATFVNAFAVSGGTPARSFNEYVAWVKGAGGGKGAVGVPAPASVPEFLVKLVGQKYQLDLVAAPYRGSAPLMADMLGNQIAAGVGSVPDLIENHKAGKLRVVAVLGGARQAVLPDVPTFAELGLAGFEDVPYYGVFAPAGTP